MFIMLTFEVKCLPMRSCVFLLIKFNFALSLIENITHKTICLTKLFHYFTYRSSAVKYRILFIF